MRSLVQKILMRIKWFVKEAVPFVLLGVLIVNLLYTFKVIEFAGLVSEPIVTGILGLPKEAAGALITGFLRKDVAVGMLIPLQLTAKQLVIASVVLAMYFPCIATFTVLIKELGIKDMIKSAAIMFITSLVVGGFLNLVLP